MQKEELIKFEEEIAEIFNSGKIKAPVHLYHGNEEQIINIFKNIKKEDWVFCSWRSHYQCLLKGVPKKEIYIPRSNAALAVSQSAVKQCITPASAFSSDRILMVSFFASLM